MNDCQFVLHSQFSPCGDQPQAIANLLKSFNDGKCYQTLLGVTGSGKTFTMANLIAQLAKKTLVLAPNKTLAAQLYEELKEFFPENSVEYFISYYDYYQPEAYVPGTDTYIEKDSAINEEIDKLRHRATRSLIERDDVVVVASVSCIYGIGSPAEYSEQRMTLFCGEKYDFQQFIYQLIHRQYQRDHQGDFSRGKFRVRGETVEIFPAYEDELVYRLEFFDGELEQIYKVDPLRGEVKEELNKVNLYPNSHYAVGQERLKTAIKSIQIELRERVQELRSLGKEQEANRLTQRTLLDIEMMEEMGFCSGIENYSRHLSGAKAGEPPPTLIEFFGDDFLMIVDESHITIPQVGGMYKGDRARKMNLVEYGFRLPSALDNRPLNFEEFEKRHSQVLFVSATPGQYELEKTQGEFVEQIIRPTGLLDPVVEVRKAKNQVEDFMDIAKQKIEQGFRVLVTTLTKKLAEELCSYYTRMGLKVRYLHSDIDSIERIEILRDLRLGEFDILVGINLLREGLDLPEVALVGIMDADREGFLRSTRSLIQTIGRAARNEQGQVILYAHKMTASMQEAIAITQARRKKQNQYNIEHNITPQTIQKQIKGGVIEALRGSNKKERAKQGAEQKLEFENIQQLEEHIIQCQNEMKQMAKDLQFEKAIELRERVQRLNKMRILYL